MNETKYEPAAWVVMTENKPVATRPTLMDALAVIPIVIEQRIRQGYSYQGCAMYVVPTDEMREAPNAV